MGANLIPDREDGQRMDDRWFNSVRDAISRDVVARNASTGIAEDLAGSIGTSSYRFLKAFIAMGYWDTGDIKMHLTYNGTVDAGEGWMLLDGRQVTEANYNTEHGAAHWATYVGSSVLLNKYLPNFTSRYPIGAATTTQDGSIAITAVGNVSHQVNFRHRHRWYKHNSSHDLDDQIFNSSGVATDLGQLAIGGEQWAAMEGTGVGNGIPNQDLYTWKALKDDSSEVSTTQSIEPESIEFQFYMRII